MSSQNVNIDIQVKTIGGRDIFLILKDKKILFIEIAEIISSNTLKNFIEVCLEMNPEINQMTFFVEQIMNHESDVVDIKNFYIPFCKSVFSEKNIIMEIRDDISYVDLFVETSIDSNSLADKLKIFSLTETFYFSRNDWKVLLGPHIRFFNSDFFSGKIKTLKSKIFNFR